MNYYQEKDNQYQFLYLLPTYSYIIDQPLKYKTFLQMIAIFAQNEQKDQSILIYDLHNKALNSMILIIQVNEQCNIFNFLSASQFIYVYNNELRVQVLDQVKILFKSDIFRYNMNSYFYKPTLCLNLIPRIQQITIHYIQIQPSSNVIIGITIILITYQKLYLLTDNQQNYFIYNKKKIFPLNDVFGKITSVTYTNGDTQTNLSSLTLVDKQGCTLFKQKTCILQNNEIIIDYFDLRLNLQFNRSQIINRFTVFKSEFNTFIHTIDEYKVLRIHNYNLEGRLIEQSRIQTLFQLDRIALDSIQAVENLILFESTSNKQTKLLFFIQNYQLQQFLIDGVNEFRFISIHKTPKFYFITFETFCKIQNSETFNFLFLSFQFDIIKKTNVSLTQIVLPYSIIQQLRFSDSEFVQDNDNFKFELLICFSNLHCHYFQFQFDSQYNFLGSKILKILRYQISQPLKEIEFVSSKYVILSFYHYGNIKYIYNTSQSNKLIIVSRQQIELGDYQIEKYNDTYFTVFKCNPDCDVQLFQLHNYYVSCLYACDDQQVSLLLSNRVNQLNITFQNFLIQMEINYHPNKLCHSN